jgi:hypothetical protein
LTRTRESLVLIPSKKTCWEIHLYLLKKPASAATPSAKKSLMSLHSHHHNTIIIPSLIYTPSSTILCHYPAYNSSFCIFDTSFVKSTMTVISVWERKKERKKWINSWRATARAVVSTSSVPSRPPHSCHYSRPHPPCRHNYPLCYHISESSTSHQQHRLHSTHTTLHPQRSPIVSSFVMN